MIFDNSNDTKSIQQKKILKIEKKENNKKFIIHNRKLSQKEIHFSFREHNHTSPSKYTNQSQIISFNFNAFWAP